MLPAPSSAQGSKPQTWNVVQAVNHASWAAGYASVQQYTANFYPQLAPDHLNFATLLNGAKPPETGERFNYFELGCGQGVTAMLLASSYPAAHFYANDFMPAHLAGAEEMRRRGGIDNITLLDASFADLAEGSINLPLMDFISLHGVYTWISAENRSQIVRFIARYLKPGGLVYVSYNAMPGWAAASPLQRLMREFEMQSTGDSAARISKAMSFIQRLKDVGADSLSGNPDIDRRLAQMQARNSSYLAHEYLADNWQPMYHSDVARDFAMAKLEHVGSSALIMGCHEFPVEQQAMLDSVDDPALKETIKDFLLGSGFRQDIFVRGRRSVSKQQRRHLLGSYTAVPALPLDQIIDRVELRYAGNPFGRQFVGGLVRALMSNALIIDELIQLPGAMGDQELVLFTLACLSELGAVHLVAGGQTSTKLAAPHALNVAIANSALNEEGGWSALASPAGHSGLHLTLLERCVFSLIHTERSQSADRLLSALMEKLNQFEPLRGRLSATSIDTSEQGLRAHLTHTLHNSLPLWKRVNAVSSCPFPPSSRAG